MACDLVDQCRPLSTEGDHGRKLRRNDIDIRSHIRGEDIAKLNSLVPALQKRDRGFDHKLKPHFSIEIARVAYPSTSWLYSATAEFQFVGTTKTQPSSDSSISIFNDLPSSIEIVL